MVNIAGSLTANGSFPVSSLDIAILPSLEDFKKNPSSVEPYRQDVLMDLSTNGSEKVIIEKTTEHFLFLQI